MNEAWPWRPLGELFEIGAGKTMSAAARNGPDKIPFLRTSNVLWDEIDLSSVDEMSIPEHELPAKLLRPGDLLVCEGGEIGRAAIWTGEVEPMSFQNHLHRLRPIEDVEPRFYVHFLQSAFTQLGIFEGAANKTTIPNLSRSRLAALKVPQPPKEEQSAIVKALRQIRKSTGLQNRGLNFARDLKRAAMETLFTTGLREEPKKQTEIGSVPQSWTVCPLGRLCVTTDTVDLKAEHSRVVEYVDVSSISRTFLTIDSTYKTRLRDAPGRARKRIRSGDVIFATVRPTLLRAARVTANLDNQVCSTAFCVLRDDPAKVAGAFIYYLVQREAFVRQLAAIESGASYPAVTDRVVKGQVVPVPDYEEQLAMVSILESVDRKMDFHRRKAALLDELFKSLLRKLMTGETRVSDFDTTDR